LSPRALSAGLTPRKIRFVKVKVPGFGK